MRAGCFVMAVMAWSSLASATPHPKLINGQPIKPGTYHDVVRIVTSGSACTATIVGPNVIITAAHCGATGATARFNAGDRTYAATLERSRLYPTRDHDIAVGITRDPIVGVHPASVGGKATLGMELTLLGYGCTHPGGSGGNDGILRIGRSQVIGSSGYDMVSRRQGGAALCFGDSGGPSFVKIDGKRFLLGINSKGNIRDTNYNTRTDLKITRQFLQRIVNENDVEICGINLDCEPAI